MMTSTTASDKSETLGKGDIVELLTGQKCKDRFWATIANDPEKGALVIQPEDMDNVYQAVTKFRTGRIEYGEHSFNYYSPALNEIETAYQKRDFEAFKVGCDSLLGKIGMD